MEVDVIERCRLTANGKISTAMCLVCIHVYNLSWPKRKGGLWPVWRNADKWSRWLNIWPHSGKYQTCVSHVLAKYRNIYFLIITFRFGLILFRLILASNFNFVHLFVRFRITDEGSIPKRTYGRHCYFHPGLRYSIPQVWIENSYQAHRP